MLEKISSPIRLKQICENLKKRIKLKIFRYNKEMQGKLNITTKDFEIFFLLREINQKLNLNIKDIDDRVLNLSEKKLGNDIFTYLKKIEFTELREIILYWNEISNINAIKELSLNKLETLDLRKNNISNI